VSTEPGTERADDSIPTPDASRRLEIHAVGVSVDKTSRIDMTGRGYSGARDPQEDGSDINGHGPSGHQATGGTGGSHGGRGGRPSNGSTATAAAPYDSAANPTQPGGGGSVWDVGRGTAGGGVLILDAGTL
jgi:hypothetical protein